MPSADTGRGGRTHLLYAVTRGDMTDFVTEYAGQFGFRVQITHDAAGDVDVAAGQCKGIDFG